MRENSLGALGYYVRAFITALPVVDGRGCSWTTNANLTSISERRAMATALAGNVAYLFGGIENRRTTIACSGARTSELAAPRSRQ